MPVKNRKERYLIIILALFTAGYIIHNLIFLRYNNEVNCLESTIKNSIQRYYRIQDSPSIAWKEFWNCVGPQSKERALYELFCLPFYLIFGVSAQTAVYANFLFLILLIFSVYKIGAMVGDGYLGFLACFQLLMYPAIFGFTRMFFTSLATTSLVSFGIYCILSSDYFKNTGKIALLFLCGIILIKLKLEKILVYLLVPLTIYLYGSFLANKVDPVSRKKFYRNLIIFSCVLLLAVLTGALGFASKINYYLFDVDGVSNALRVSSHLSLVDTVTIYLKDLFFMQAGQLGTILFVLGLFFFIKEKLRYKSILVSWILVPYLFHSMYFYFSGIHASYYTIEYLPAVALVTSGGIYHLCKIKRKLLAAAVCVIYILLNLINYAAVNYYDRQLPFFERVKEISFLGKICRPSPVPAQEEYFKVAQGLIEKIVVSKKKASVVFINHYPLLLDLKNRLGLYNAIKRNKIVIYDFSDLLFNLELPDSAEVLFAKIKNADLIINGNRFFPVGSCQELKHYKQFGTVYDFSQQEHLEEEGFNKVLGDFYLAMEIKNAKIEITFFVNNNLGEALGKLTRKAPESDKMRGSAK